MATYVQIWPAGKWSIYSLTQQIEVAVVKDAIAIFSEDPSTADHTRRLAWARYTLRTSAVIIQYFLWPAAFDPNIQAAVAEDPSGAAITDDMVQSVVDAQLPTAIADWEANPPGGNTFN